MRTVSTSPLQHLDLAVHSRLFLLLQLPKMSRNLVAYMAGLVAVGSYKNGPFDSRAKGVVEHASTEAMKNPNKNKNKPYMAYLKHKLGEWYKEAQGLMHKQPVDDEEEPKGGCAVASCTSGEA